MALIEIQWNPPARFLRQFAGIFGLVCLLLASWLWFKHDARTAAQVVGGVGILIAAVGWFWPAVVRWLYLGWMIVFYPVGWIMSLLILAAIFYLVIAPIGLVMKLIGRNPMPHGFDPSAKSYWIARPTDTPHQRYFRQF